jgi:hypothetical protein
MELSERIIATLEAEGCPSVYEETLGSYVTAPLHTPQTLTALVVTDGSIEVTFDNIPHILEPGNRLDIPADTTYSVIAGKTGCNYVVGEF